MLGDGEKIVKINCILQDESAERFKEIKKRTGLKQNTEVIRLAVNVFFEKLTKAKKA